MKDFRATISNWIEHRTGAETAIRNFLYEEIPASSGWQHVFGSVALFLFMVQAFTGILLAFNYSPTPGDAYNSLRYILTELTGGLLVRGLHHWGASMMIVTVVGSSGLTNAYVSALPATGRLSSTQKAIRGPGTSRATCVPSRADQPFPPCPSATAASSGWRARTSGAAANMATWT